MQTILISPSQATENVVSSQICIFYTPINGKNPYKPSRPYKNVSKFGLSGPLLPLKPFNQALWPPSSGLFGIFGKSAHVCSEISLLPEPKLQYVAKVDWSDLKLILRISCERRYTNEYICIYEISKVETSVGLGMELDLLCETH